MVRIGGSTEKGEHIKENHYYTPSGEFRVDAEGSSTLHNCLMYKLCYYRFGQLYTEGGESKFSLIKRVFLLFRRVRLNYWKCPIFYFWIIGKPPGYDRVRHAEIGNKDFELNVVEEAYTTEHWVVRIYKVKDLPNRGV